jgi:hypothetical protein
MDRALLIAELQAYKPEDGHELRMRELMVEFIDRNEECASRRLSIGHLTGSAWIVNPEMSHVLPTHHRRLDLWVQLGGTSRRTGYAWRHPGVARRVEESGPG